VISALTPTFELLGEGDAARVLRTLATGCFQQPAWVHAVAAARGRPHETVVVRARDVDGRTAWLPGAVHRRHGLAVFEAMPMGGYGGWLADPAGNLRLATDLLAWGGIAFLWFIGAVRTHIGAREDRFLASVYFGSGLLFLAMCFVGASATQALLAAHDQYGERFFDSGTFAFGSRLTYEVTNTYALRMAGVFMFSLATLSHRTGALPRPFVWGTWVLGALLVLGLTQTLWAALLFPAWVLGLSLYLLLARRRD